MMLRRLVKGTTKLLIGLDGLIVLGGLIFSSLPPVCNPNFSFMGEVGWKKIKKVNK